MKGHFIYLSVGTVEGENLQITSSQQGFFINRSDNHRFDPQPKQATKNQPNASHIYHSLFDLLSSVSPQFLAHIQKIPLYMLPNAPDFYAGAAITHCPAAAPWLVQLPDTTADAIRSQIPYALTGSTGLETLPVARDWNEEHTAMRELPRATNDDRLVRDRFGSRLQAEFQAAAARGVQCIVRGDVPSLNALDSPEARSYLFHNILFTQALDSVDLMKHVGGDEALRISSAKDLHAMSLLANADVQGIHTIATAVIDYAGERWVAQSIPPGIFNRAAPEEPKAGEDGTSADPAAVQPGLRAVYGPKDTEKPLDGYIADESFAPLAEKVAKQFHLAQHTVQDTHGKETAMWLPADVHGVAAADGRSYVIDLCKRVERIR
jgi:protein TIF31